MDDCTKLPVLIEMQEQIKAHETRLKRLESNDDAIGKLMTAVEVLIERVSNMQININNITNTVEKLSDVVDGVKTDVTIIKNVSSDVDTLRSDVEKMKLEPAEDYKHYKRSMINYILTALAGLIIGVITKL